VADTTERHIAILETRITGEEDVRKYAAEFNKLATETRKAGQAIKQSGQDFNSFGSSFSRSIAGVGGAGIVLRNTSAQLQDFAVQVGFGTSVLQAFGQQAPQLLSAFGTFGTVLGTVVAVTVALPALAAAFKAVTGAAKDSEGQVGRFKESFGEFRRLLEDIDFAPKKFDAKNMIEQFNLMDEATRKTYVNLLKINQQAAEFTQSRSLADLQASLKDIAGTGGILDGFKSPSQKLIDEFNLRADGANELFNLFNKLNKTQEDYIRLAELTANASTEAGRKFNQDVLSLAKGNLELGNRNKQLKESIDLFDKSTSTGVPEAPAKGGRTKALKEEKTALEEVSEAFEKYQLSVIKAQEETKILEGTFANLEGDAGTSINERIYLIDQLIERNKILNNSEAGIVLQFKKNALELQKANQDLELINNELQSIGQPQNEADRVLTELLLRKKEELLKTVDILKFKDDVKEVKDAVAATQEKTIFEQIKEDIQRSQAEVASYPAIIRAINEELDKMNGQQLDSPIGRNLVSRRNDFIEALNKDNPSFEFFKGFSDTAFGGIENTMNTLINSFGRTQVSFSDMVDSMITDLTRFVTNFFIQKALEQLLSIGLSFFGGGAVAGAGTINTAGLNTQLGNFFGGVGADAPGQVDGETSFIRSNTIIPLRRGMGGSGNGEVTVNVYNNGDNQVRSNSREDDKQNRIIDIYIETKVKDQFANGKMDGILRNRFGLRRTPG